MARENALKYVKENIEKWSEKRPECCQKKEEKYTVTSQTLCKFRRIFLQMLTHFIASFPEYHDFVPLAPTFFRKITVSIMSLSNSSNSREKGEGGNPTEMEALRCLPNGPASGSGQKQLLAKREETRRGTDLSSSGTAFRQVR